MLSAKWLSFCLCHNVLTHICISNITIIGSDNGLLPGQRQAIIWTNAGILSIGPLGPNFSEILSEIYVFSFKKMHLKMSSAKWSFCLCHNVLSTKGSLLQYFCNGISVCLALNHWRGVSYGFFPCKAHIIFRFCCWFMNFYVCNVRMQLNKFDAVSSIRYVTLVAMTGLLSWCPIF